MDGNDKATDNLEQDWEIERLVIIENGSRVLVAGHSGDTSDLLFLVDQHTGDVFVRQPDGSWEHIFGPDSRSVISHMVAARNRNIPVYSQ